MSEKALLTGHGGVFGRVPAEPETTRQSVLLEAVNSLTGRRKALPAYRKQEKSITRKEREQRERELTRIRSAQLAGQAVTRAI